MIELPDTKSLRCSIHRDAQCGVCTVANAQPSEFYYLCAKNENLN